MGIKRFIDSRPVLRVPFYRLANRLLVRPRLRLLGVPVAAVTGSNGKSTVVRLLDLICREAGFRVGACCTDGVLHQGHWQWNDDQAGAGGAFRASCCPGADVLVLEAARGGIIDYGLGFSSCQVGVVTNILEDHLEERGVSTLEEMARVKAAVPRSVAHGGTAVLNHDSPLVRAMGTVTRGHVIWFSPSNAYHGPGPCWFLEDGFIKRRGEGRVETFMVADDVPATLGGLLPYNAANCLAALAAVEGLRDRLAIPWYAARTVLASYGSDHLDPVNRFRLLRYRGAHVLLCHSKNPDAAFLDAPAVLAVRRALGSTRTVGLLTYVGNRPDRAYRRLAANLADTCDLFLLAPPRNHYLRGREGSELVSLLSGGLPPEKVAANGNRSLEELLDARLGESGNLLLVSFLPPCERRLDERVLARDAQPVSLRELLKKGNGC